MKPTRFLFLFLAALVPWTLQAQTEVPERISYQGIITDVSGNLVGDPNPVNRNVIFRIWDHQTNSNFSNLLYSEQTVATISKGEFSVLVGGGADVTSQAQFGFSETSKGPGTGKLADALAGSTRYLGVTVDDGTGAPDLEITPRQQIVTTAFSFRAKVAESALTANTVGSVLSLSGNTVNMTNGFTANAASTVNGLLDVDDLSVDNGVLEVNPTTNTVTVGGTLDVNGTTSLDGLTIESATPSLLIRNTAETYAGISFEDTGTTSEYARIHFNSASTNEFSFYNGSTTPRLTIQENGAVSIPGALTAGTLSGNGSGLTSLSGANLANGSVTSAKLASVGDDKLSSNVPLLDRATNSFTGSLLATTSLTAPTINLTDGATISGPDPVILIENTLENDAIIKFEDKDTSVGTTHYCAIQYNSTNNNLHFYNGSPNTTTSAEPRLTIKRDGGNVGIGTTNPTKGKLEVSGSSGLQTFASVYLNKDVFGTWNGSNGGQSGDAAARVPLADYTAGANFPFSIYADSNIAAPGFAAFSDARIKRVEGRSDSGRDLAALLDIEITDYTHIDTIAKGPGRHKKVVAQQVEKVFPQAVSKSTDEIPDIMSKAKSVDGWVQLETDLKQGERVRLIGEKEEGVHEVLEVRAGAFRTAFKPSTEKVFVYGREVKDFRTVDYDAIAMLNVSATQELARQLESKNAEIAALKKEVAVQAERLAGQELIEARLSKLEALLSKGATVSN